MSSDDGVTMVTVHLEEHEHKQDRVSWVSWTLSTPLLTVVMDTRPLPAEPGAPP